MSAPAVTAPYLAATVILAGAGVAKLRRPDDTARALLTAGLPAHRRLVRAGAVAEVALAVAAWVAPGPLTGALVAASYAGFAAFVAIALSRGWPLASCGCFGRPDSRPTWWHVLLDAGAATVAAWWAVAAPVGMGAVFSSEPWAGVPVGLEAVVIAGLAYLVWTNPLDQEVAA